MKIPAVLGVVLAATTMLAVRAPQRVDRSGPIFGFTDARAQRALEAKYLRLPSAKRAEEHHRFLTAEPHAAGTPRDRALAEWVRDQWRAYGIDQVEIVEHEVLLPYPEEVSIEMIAPRPWRASMKEEPIRGDPSTQRPDVGIPYHAYSASGDVTADVVYAASGNPADYDWLAGRGIDIKGRIALVRYSVPYSYRGFKALTAEQRGAAGILIYSDPADDGYKKGKVYPDGPWGPESHIQRGGIVYDFKVPGDPLTPGWASVPGARRIAATDAVSLPRIMSAPLSYKDARVILDALGGPEAPAAWHGGLPIKYRVGPGPARVRMRLRMDDRVRPIWTVIGTIRGRELPDELVVLGNHRDAWIFGGVDPSSGSASLMEVARGLGDLARRGDRPRRSTVLASWDAEEFTLTSSTEWGEQFEAILRDRAVAYLNVDSSTSGRQFGAAAVPALNRFITEAAASVRDPATGVSIATAWRDRRSDDRGALPGGGGPTMVNNRLGSGSDYTVFLNFLGVPIVDMTFDGPYGVYHSIYDNHRWVSTIGDPGFRYHATMAELWGLMALRLANADRLPLDYTPYASLIGAFLDELERQTATWTPQAAGHFAPAREAAKRFEAAARGTSKYPSDEAANRRLMRVERAFLDADGIPGRPWYRHLIYAPRFTYAAEVLPGVTEASESRDEARLTAQIAKLVVALDRAAAALKD